MGRNLTTILRALGMVWLTWHRANLWCCFVMNLSPRHIHFNCSFLSLNTSLNSGRWINCTCNGNLCPIHLSVVKNQLKPPHTFLSRFLNSRTNCQIFVIRRRTRGNCEWFRQIYRPESIYRSQDIGLALILYLGPRASMCFPASKQIVPTPLVFV